MTKERKQRIETVVAQRQHGLTVILEDIHDPHNAAAILRSCDAYGIQAVHFIFENESVYDPKMLGKQSSSSANKWITCYSHTSTKSCLATLKKQGYTIYATTLHEKAVSLFTHKFPSSPIALLFGNEHGGISKTGISLSDEKILIPMRGMIESLNVSVTVGTILYEVTRQRIENETMQTLSSTEKKVLLKQFMTMKS